ncbi:unnamed protein product, partial [marine sediment metagenome]
RLYLEGITTFANCFPLLSNGVVREIQHSREQTTIEIEDRADIMYHDIGTYLTDADAADTGQGLPGESREKIKPIIYGDQRHYQGNDSKALDTVSPINNMTPCIYIGQDLSGIGSTRHWWYVAGHKVEEIALALHQNQIWGWSDTLNRLVRLISVGDVAIIQNTTDGCIFTTPNDPYFHDYRYGKGTVTTATQGAQASVSDEARIIDKQFDVYSRLLVGANDGVGDFAKVTIPFSDYDGQGIDDDNIITHQFFWYGKLYYYGGAGDTDFEITIDVAGIPDPDRYPTGAGYPDTRLVSNLTGTKDAIAASVELKLEKKIAANTEYAHLYVYEAYKAVNLRFGKVIPLYFAG